MDHQPLIRHNRGVLMALIRVSAIYGGIPKLEQIRVLKAGCEVVVCTPVRTIILRLCSISAAASASPSQSPSTILIFFNRGDSLI